MEKKLSLIILILFLSTITFSQKSKKIKLQSTQDSISYFIGADIGANLVKQGIEVDAEIMMAAMVDAINGEELLLNEEEKQKVVQALNAIVQQKQLEQQKKDQEMQAQNIEQVKKESAAFLEENKKRPEVKVTESGLQYEVIKEGTGISPTAMDKVTVHYVGTLINGQKFDSSRDRGQPATFGLNQVIPGWTEGVQLMKEGAIYKFYIPSKLGYGDTGAGGSIPGGAALVFEVELIKVVK